MSSRIRCHFKNRFRCERNMQKVERLQSIWNRGDSQRQVGRAGSAEPSYRRKR
jgi:hypothetical protein